MNRKQRRELKVDKKEYSLKDVQEAITIAVAMRQLTKGHLFSKNLKDKCVFCGVGMKTKKQCAYHVLTLLDRFQSILINPSFYTADNLEALYLQNTEEYQNIKLPLIIT